MEEKMKKAVDETFKELLAMPKDEFLKEFQKYDPHYADILLKEILNSSRQRLLTVTNKEHEGLLNRIEDYLDDKEDEAIIMALEASDGEYVPLDPELWARISNLVKDVGL